MSQSGNVLADQLLTFWPDHQLRFTTRRHQHPDGEGRDDAQLVGHSKSARKGHGRLPVQPVIGAGRHRQHPRP